MNAPATKAETHAHYAAQLAAAKQMVIDAKQPSVTDCGNHLIASGAQCGHLTLDFYGEYFKGEGHLVTGIALQGHKFNLYDLFTSAQILDFQAACDRHNERDDAAEAEFDRAEAMAARGDV